MIRFRDIFRRAAEEVESPPKVEEPTESIPKPLPPGPSERTEVMRRRSPRPDGPPAKAPRQAPDSPPPPEQRSKERITRISREVSKALEEIMGVDGVPADQGGGDPEKTEEWEMSLDEVLEKYSVEESNEARTETLSQNEVDSLRTILAEETRKGSKRQEKGGSRRKAKG